MVNRPVLLLISIAAAASVNAQQRESLPIVPFSYITQASDHIGAVQQKLERKLQKTLRQWWQVETRIWRKLAKTDSLKANQVFRSAEQKYEQLEQKLGQTSKLKQYISSLDTLSTSLKFLQQNPQLLSKTKEIGQKLNEALGKVTGLESRLPVSKLSALTRISLLYSEFRSFGFVVANR